MIVVDFIIANTDRHLENFGFIRNVDTLKWLGMGPIFDNGKSLWFDSQFIDNYPNSKPFRPNHHDQLKLVKDLSWFDKSMLEGVVQEVEEILKQSIYISDDRRHQLLKHLERRIEMVETYKNQLHQKL